MMSGFPGCMMGVAARAMVVIAREILHPLGEVRLIRPTGHDGEEISQVYRVLALIPKKRRSGQPERANAEKVADLT